MVFVLIYLSSLILFGIGMAMVLYGIINKK